MRTFIGGIGCFWDETKYEGIEGVISTECGYCGCLLYTSPSPRDS